MSENTSIEWCDHTFNPWEGCQKIGPGCDHCYAETRNARFGGGQAVNWGSGAPRRRTSPGNWRKPLAWNAAHAEFFAQHGRRQRVFCASLADVFDNAVDPAWRADLFGLIQATPNLDWLLLTKRIGNVEAMLRDIRHGADEELSVYDLMPLPNVWIGATVIDQTEANRDIPKLLALPARVRFLSMEPLLAPVNLESMPPANRTMTCSINALTGQAVWPDGERMAGPRLHWVIAGGESGPKARPMHPDWIRSLRDQCVSANVPFLFKQWGTWKPVTSKVEVERYPTFVKREPDDKQFASSCCYHEPHQTWSCVVDPRFAWRHPVIKVGTKIAGRLLDGVQHDGFPEVA